MESTDIGMGYKYADSSVTPKRSTPSAKSPASAIPPISTLVQLRLASRGTHRGRPGGLGIPGSLDHADPNPGPGNA